MGHICTSENAGFSFKLFLEIKKVETKMDIYFKCEKQKKNILKNY